MLEERPIYIFYQLVSDFEEAKFFSILMIVMLIILQIIVIKQKLKSKEYIFIYIIIITIFLYSNYKTYHIDEAHRPLLEFYQDGMCYYNSSYENHYYKWSLMSDIKIYTPRRRGSDYIEFNIQDVKHEGFKASSISSGWNIDDLKLIALMQDYIAKAKANPAASGAPERRCTTLPEKP